MHDFSGCDESVVDRIKAFLSESSVAPENRTITIFKLRPPYSLDDGSVVLDVIVSRGERSVEFKYVITRELQLHTFEPL